jgi:hypothetical protein
MDTQFTRTYQLSSSYCVLLRVRRRSGISAPAYCKEGTGFGSHPAPHSRLRRRLLLPRCRRKLQLSRNTKDEKRGELMYCILIMNNTYEGRSQKILNTEKRRKHTNRRLQKKFNKKKDARIQIYAISAKRIDFLQFCFLKLRFILRP